MDVYLARHGQTEWNVQGRGQGQLDSPLTPLGVAQALSHARTLAGVPFTRAYCSPLGRARRSAELILRGRDVPLIPLEDLREVDHGALAGLLPHERQARYPELAEARRQDKFGTVMPGGESYETASPRAARVAALLWDQPGPVLVVSHEMIGRLLRLHLLGLTPQEALRTGQPQDTLYRVTASGGQVSLQVSGVGQPFTALVP
ncbi:histidine phosphatase family protein [Deinococcus sp. A31D244]|jgi:broad specificity phosphatase PhoE|uniref:Phosphoglycerate mutase n=1 Tax=Deinococcus knuensis TaxID=1837380 RepID=A0ABQ2SI07_9DEIO|nr:MULTISPECIES: histidine phosphatase family protein [Deinococcus]MBX8466658.1 histidine phosphatase family protein [Deinococcus sp. RIT780]GGS29746.1 phosphoglycerate mutase [Deinococcus knuensis]